MIAPLLLTLTTLAAAPCESVLDRTPECGAPDDVTTAIAADEKRVEQPQWDVATLPAELGFVSASLAFGGAAGLVLGLATNAANEDEAVAQQVAVITGGGLLVWSALVGAGALALAVFDPSTGTMRIKLLEGTE